MLIFDSFADRPTAQQCAEAITKQFNLKAIVCNSQGESDQIDPFPFPLVAPIVLVDRRDNLAEEAEIERIIKRRFGGTFAGT